LPTQASCLYIRYCNPHKFFLEAAAMKFSTSYFAVSRPASFLRLCMLVLSCSPILLSGCKSFGPVGAPDFDPTYSRTLEDNEQLLFSARTELVNGTYMEEEEELFPSYDGMLLLTNERILFARWNGQQQRYEPSIWTGYPYIAQVKKHNNILLQYIAIMATDGSKFTYMLDKNSVDPAYDILLKLIQQNHKTPMPAGHQ
jgi:hypothetical protein